MGTLFVSLSLILAALRLVSHPIYAPQEALMESLATRPFPESGLRLALLELSIVSVQRVLFR